MPTTRLPFLLPADPAVSSRYLSPVMPINPDLLTDRWSSAWCRHPREARTASSVYLFRKTIALETVPATYIVHVSADQRYRLWVNGKDVSFGPARGDLRHWRYDTVDLAPFLVLGENVVAVRVHHYDETVAPVFQISAGAAFLCQGDGDAEKDANTPSGWKVCRDPSYSFSEEEIKVLWTYCVIGPCEHFDARQHPQGWLLSSFDANCWDEATLVKRNFAAPYGLEEGESQWWMVPRSIPLMEEVRETWGNVVRAEGLRHEPGPLSLPLTVPARTRVTLLFDRGQETCAFPRLNISGGKDARLRLAYAEALVGEGMKANDPQRKGNRNETEGRVLQGYADFWISDGSNDRLLDTLWWKTYRYAELIIETDGEPLVLNDLYGIYTGYPFAEEAQVSLPGWPEAAKLWEVSWRTLRLCSHETFTDCPYYEQLQYIGDTRIQALISLYVSGDARLFRNALSQMDDSRLSDGLTQSRYPSRIAQIIAPFSLWWVGMVHDYVRHVPGDDTFVRSLLPGVRGVTDWFRDRLTDDNLLGPLEWWDFADWCTDWRYGTPPGAKEGGSALLSLQLVLALRERADLEEGWGRASYAGELREQAQTIAEAVRLHCYDQENKRVADTPDHQTYSQHTAILSVLADAIPQEEQAAVLERTLSDTSLSQATFYFRFYLNRALVKAGLADRYRETLEPWYEMLRLGLTTWAENPEPTRSDCHAWSASPAYELLATVLGIMPDAPGFASVRLSPALGDVMEASGRMPHPSGEITVSYRRDGNRLTANVTLPDKVTGTLVWRGGEQSLTGGAQTVVMP